MRVHVPVHLRWADLDAYNHVNNVAMLRILEESRVRAFWLPETSEDDSPPTAVLDASSGAATLSLIASHQIEYLLPLSYQRQPLDVQIWIGRLGGASAELYYEVVAGGTTYARATTTMVFVDAVTQRPRRIAESEREAWRPYIEDPVVFTKRAVGQSTD